MDKSTKQKGLTLFLDAGFLQARAFPFEWPESTFLPTEVVGSLPDINTGPHITKNQQPAFAARFASLTALGVRGMKGKASEAVACSRPRPPNLESGSPWGSDMQQITRSTLP